MQKIDRSVPPIERLERRALFSADLVTNARVAVSVDDAELRAYITDYEGFAQHAYRDADTGRPTVGVGFDLKRRGAKALVTSLGLDYRQLLREARTPEEEATLSVDQVNQLFDADLTAAIDAARASVDNFDALSHRQQAALVDIAFTGGAKYLRTLRKAVAAVEAGDWSEAATQITDSKYARADGVSAERLADNVELIQSPADAGSPPPVTEPTPTPTPTTTPTPTPTPAPAPLTAPLVAPASDGRYGIQISPGQVTLPDGRTIDVAGGVLDVDTPEVKPHVRTFSNPADYAGQADTVRWPDWSVNLVPTSDTLTLGGLYHAVIPESVVMTNSSGQVMQRDVDYKLNEDWGQILELHGRLGTTETYMVKYDAVKQRLDLVEVMPDGSVVVKRGTSAQQVPSLPDADAGAAPLAGIYVYTIDGARESGFTLAARDIMPIQPAAPVMPINPDAIPNTLAKLRAGGHVNIAFFGDSITDGAEAGKWWEDRSQTYTQLVLDGLSARFPNATITGTLASQGGKGATDSQGVFQQHVLDVDAGGNPVDLVVIAMGMNDKGSSTMSSFNAAMNDYIDKARAAGIEVMLVTPLQSNIYYEVNQTDRVPRARIAEAILAIGEARDATVIDVQTEWNNLATRGIAPLSQLHNMFNHPGALGMRLYADTILRAFPA